MNSPAFPIRLKKGCDDAVRKGMPWIYLGDIVESSEAMLAEPGSIVAIENHKGQPVGVGYFNPKSQIACRVLTLGREAVDVDFFARRLHKAVALREKLIDMPYYRLVHSEADGLPGLLMDRFGDVFVAQAGTAGMEKLQPLWLAALETLFHPEAIILRNDTSARKHEGLVEEVRILPSPSPLVGEGGEGGLLQHNRQSNVLRQPPLPNPPPRGGRECLVDIHENNCLYLADLLRGQKTGWFYDQRDNRKMIAGLAKDKTLIDIYSHSGGFGLLAAKAGAQVTMVDSSKLALELAAQAAQRNGVADRCEYLQGDAFAIMEQLHKEGKQFDIVLADPPAFVKSKKDIASGLKGYAKVARLSAALVKPGGYSFIASCSHYASRSGFQKAVLDGIAKAGRQGEIIKHTGAAPDHPRHPLLPQSEYLKGILLKC